MVDRVYKSDLPAMRGALEELRREFSRVPSKTDWRRVRVDPVLRHVRALEAVLASSAHSEQLGRLRRGVELFHSDLVYLRTNIRGLQKVLEAEKRAHRGP